MTTLYKVLVNGKSCHGGDLEWSLPTQNADGTWTPGAWHEVEGEIVVCENGLHLTTQPYARWMEWNATVYEAEGAGDSDSDDDDKIAYRRARLLRPAPVPEWWAAAQEFVKSIKDVKFFQPDGDPDPKWRLFTAPTWDAALAAAGVDAQNAAWVAALDVARNAAFAAADAAARNAAWVAADAGALDVALAAADAAVDAAVLDAARVAARDARLNVLMAIISDLDVPQQHRDHAAARWRVWQKGYALLCDVNGVLYVYAQEVGA